MRFVRLMLLLVHVLLSGVQGDDETVSLVLSAANFSNDSNLSLNNTEPVSTRCTTAQGKEGVCVEPAYCKQEQETIALLGDACENRSYICCPSDRVKDKPTKHIDLENECGWSNSPAFNLPSSSSLSSDSGYAGYAEFPWMVAVLEKSDVTQWEQDYIGGGILIHPSVVLTVAHKVQNKDSAQIKCRAGEWDVQTESEILLHQDRSVTKISIHHDCLPLYAHYNAAMLFLESPFELDGVKHIGVACLARDMPTLGSLCYTMGWGKSLRSSVYFTNTETSTVLKKEEVTMLDADECQRRLRNTRLGSRFQLHHSLMCANINDRKDNCVGDGGSPLVCPVQAQDTPTRYLVYGMAAFSLYCGVRGGLDVYVKVPSIVDWVNRVMDEEQLNKTTYVYKKI